MSERATPTREHVADRLHSASIHLLRRVRGEDELSGLSAARLSALSVVVFAGPLTLGRLAAAEQVRPPTMSKIVTGLEEEGLVERRPDPSDGRVVLIRATPKGNRLLQRARKRRIAHLADRLEGLDEGELALLAEAAEIVERRLRN
jgi:DNA-binding MarR family transcriptional regulator